MTRREVLALGAVTAAKPRGAGMHAEVFRINLRHTWTTTMSSSDYRDVIYTRLTRDGITGRGEGAPIVRYKETAAAGVTAIDSLAPLFNAADLRHFRKLLEAMFAKLPGHWAAKSAIDIALMDWNAQRLGVPLYRLFGVDAADAPLTTFSIGIDNPEMTRQKVREAEPFPILKIKVGLERDEETIAAVRSVTRKPIRPDANEGFRSADEAIRKINWLDKQGAEFIEQPLPAHMLEEQRKVRRAVHIPILADEACLHPEDVPKIADAYDGIVVKLDKAGGTLAALDMIRLARAYNLKVLLGCMVSTSVSITAAAHLSPLADWADLDGNLLISNDPYRGVVVRDGRLVLPNRPGLGLQPRATKKGRTR